MNRLLCSALFSAVVLFGCGPQITNRDSQGAAIVCFGDSLTAGFRVGAGEDYPSILRTKVDLPVINAGISGDTTPRALSRLETDVLAQDPRIVILTLGVNDFLRGIPPEETLRNAEAIIDRIHRRGAMVVWITMKTGTTRDSYLEGLDKLARRQGAVLIPDILRDVFFDPQYKYDLVHPNAKGYELMAERVFQKIKPFLDRR